MYATLGALTDATHALVMVLWLLGLPLLFWHRWPKLSRACGIYAVAFVVVSQASQWILGECFFTSISRMFWTRSNPQGDVGEWFSVRMARSVFRLSPSHHDITLVFELLVVVTVIGLSPLFRSRSRHQKIART